MVCSGEIDLDDPPKTIHQITPGLSFGTKIELEYNLLNDYDLTSGKDDNLEILIPTGDLGLSYEPVDWFYAFLQLSLGHRLVVNNAIGSPGSKTKLDITRAYLVFEDVVPGLSLQIGRQRIKDPREWWYDENLDAIRLHYQQGDLAMQFSVSRKELIGNDLLNADNQDEVNNYFLSGHYLFDDDLSWSTYLLFRDDHSRRKRDPIYLGLQAIGRLSKRVDFWFGSAALFGSNKQRDFRAFAVDLGATYAPKLAFNPSLTLGVAFASGDGNSKDNIDETFRQTGFEDNNAKFNGVTKFKYYGELLDPELSNLWVLTAGLGIKPSKKSSLDLVFHYYRQHRLDDRFRSDIKIDPNGKNKELGYELDIVVGFKEIKNMTTELVFGAFFPGKAYTGNADSALFSKVELSYRY